MATQAREWNPQRLQVTGSERHMIVPRLIAGLPLFFIGVSHVFVPEAPMRPLVEAANLPAPGVLAPIGVIAEIVAGVLLLAGIFARVGAILAIPTMIVAIYAHIVIDVWPNGAENEPPILLPVAVIACAAYVLWRGAGRWSLDRRMSAGRR